ncbi:MAG: glycosyltransferase family 4 protein, partial [Candidatus Levybacteria bacterium]|nr:glycosyltransferase family 4 protein [Candidatus Levybacteria bacterium]
GIAAKKISNKPLIAHIHATEFDRTCNGNINNNVYKIEKEGMEEADRVIVVSNYTKQMILSHYGIQGNKIDIVHNAINADEYPTYREAKQLKKHFGKIVLFVGRLTLQKGPDYFIRMAKRVLEVDPNVFFVVAGSGDMGPQVIAQAANNGISDRVLFTGFLRGEELAHMYQAADIFVLTSVSEPFGLTPLEALANGTPVLLSKQSGV